MKRIYFLSLAATFMLLSFANLKAQTTYTKQIIFVNGGNFSDPDDYVTIASYDPQTEVTTEFGTIYTQSVQNVLVYENYAFVAAQDSIVKFDIDTYTKVASVAATGINQLATDGDILLASFWYPATENFVQVFSLSDLTHIADVSGISDESAGFLINDGVALVAVPGGWASTTGKIASIDLSDYSLMSEDDYGDFYTGLGYFGWFNNEVTAFMKTPWGATEAHVSTFDDEGNELQQTTFTDASIGGPTGQVQDLFYCELNNGVAAYNFNTKEMDMIVQPVSLSLGASVIDSINNLVYLTTTDFVSTGEGMIFDLDGNQTGSFDAGISAQAIAVDYRLNTSVQNNIVENISAFPNPAVNSIGFNIEASEINVNVIDINGRIVLSSTSNKLDISNIGSGLYFVKIITDGKEYNSKFIKQ